ncbi:hypothetical protein [Demequina sediminicola]|uniref:hypothetical protein n=1 Tax=Demequina sediminicola TaxID=1095026 RepID=UPI00078679D9|nr:hypothetical protein [Demequina sediminicola]
MTRWVGASLAGLVLVATGCTGSTDADPDNSETTSWQESIAPAPEASVVAIVPEDWEPSPEPTASSDVEGNEGAEGSWIVEVPGGVEHDVTLERVAPREPRLTASEYYEQVLGASIDEGAELDHEVLTSDQGYEVLVVSSDMAEYGPDRGEAVFYIFAPDVTVVGRLISEEALSPEVLADFKDVAVSTQVD